MSEDSELESIVDLLDDEYARTILAATSIEPMSATQLAERCDASPPTVYRRLDSLREQDLVEAQRQLDPDGHHFEVFSARLSRLEIELEAGEYTVSIERRERDAADRFTELFEGLK